MSKTYHGNFAVIMNNEPNSLTSKFTKPPNGADNCPCGYLPFTHGEEVHLYRTNEELTKEFEDRNERRKHPAKYRKPVILELKCRICGSNDRAEYYRISFDEAGHQIFDWEPELDEEWHCPVHRDSVPIETFHDFHKKENVNE